MSKCFLLVAPSRSQTFCCCLLNDR